MRKFLQTLLLSGLVICGTSCFASLSEAADVVIHNNTPNKAAAVIIYNDDNTGKWKCRGWFMVDPRDSRRLSFPTHYKNYFWVHVHNKYLIMGNAKKWTVIDGSFSYDLDKGCPAGNHRRQIGFSSFKVGSDGVCHVSLG